MFDCGTKILKDLIKKTQKMPKEELQKLCDEADEKFNKFHKPKLMICDHSNSNCSEYCPHKHEHEIIDNDNMFQSCECYFYCKVVNKTVVCEELTI